MILYKDDFDFVKAVKIEVPETWNDIIKEVWLEMNPSYSILDSTYTILNDELNLNTARDALIIFNNNQKLLISNSEWCTLIFFNNLRKETK